MAQFARPDSDIAVDPGWASYPSGALYTCIDEETASDSDYITGTIDEDMASIGLSEVDDPIVHTGHWIRFRWRAVTNGPQPEMANIVLRQSGYPTIWSTGDVEVPRTWTDAAYELTTGQASYIEAYDILYFQFQVKQIQAQEEIQVSWIELEVPDVSSGDEPSNLMLMGVG